MLEQLCWAFFHGQYACEAAFLAHSPNCQVTMTAAAAGDAKPALSSGGSCHACCQLKVETPPRDQEQPQLEAPEKCVDEEIITDDIFKMPSREMALNEAVTITSESNAAQRRSSDRFGALIHTETTWKTHVCLLQGLRESPGISRTFGQTLYTLDR